MQAGCVFAIGLRFRPDNQLLAKCAAAGFADTESDTIAVPIKITVDGQVRERSCIRTHYHVLCWEI